MNFSKGAKYILISTVFFTAMQAMIKAMPQYTSFEHVFFRSLIGLILSVGVLSKMGIPLRAKNIKMIIVRSLVGCASMFSFFYILTTIPFGTASSFKYMSPIFATIFAAIMLKEKIEFRQWIYLIICFTGILLLKGFDTRISTLDLLIGLMAGISGGLLIVIIKKIGNDDHPLVILQYFMLVTTILSFMVIIPYWKWPNLNDAIALLSIGVIGFVAQYYFTKSIQVSEEVGSISILRYLEVLFALIAGYIWFDETYSWQSTMGIALIMAGILLSFTDKQRKLKYNKTI